MNSIHSIQAFIGEGTRVRARSLAEDGMSLQIGFGDTDLTLFVTTMSPTKAELTVAASFLDDLLVHTVELKTAVMREMVKPIHDKPFHLSYVAGCPACEVDKVVEGAPK